MLMKNNIVDFTIRSQQIQSFFPHQPVGVMFGYHNSQSDFPAS